MADKGQLIHVNGYAMFFFDKEYKLRKKNKQYSQLDVLAQSVTCMAQSLLRVLVIVRD